MTSIRILHIMKNGKYVDQGFITNLESFKKHNKNLDWDYIMTCLYNGDSFKTINQPYNNIEIQLV